MAHKQDASAKRGMPPGSAIYVGENPPLPSKVSIHIYDEKNYARQEGFNFEAIHEALEAGKHVWVDVYGLKNIKNITLLCESYGIHPLIIEDILNTQQRPKLDNFDEYLFIVFKLLDSADDELTYSTEQISLVVKRNLLLSFRESDDYDFNSLYKRLSADISLIRENGSDYLTYLIMDGIVDDYFNFVEESATNLERMEDLLISAPEDINLQALYTIRRRTLTLRKTITPLRDIVHLLIIEHGRFIDEKYRPYYRDLHDHVLRLQESVDMHRDMTTGMLDMYLSTLNNRMNQSMKVLTVFASIFIPLTFIVGVYGMNFKYMPELSLRYGYPTLMGLMAVLVALMLYFFRRKRLI